MRFLIFLALIFSADSFARELVYQADFSQMQEIDEISLEICGYPTEFRMSASAPLGPTLISKIYGNGTRSGDRTVTSELIQATEGAVGGGLLDPAYSGDYREKVYIVKIKLDFGYEPGIYNRVQVNTFGPKDAPTGFIVHSELLNHRYSAELSEGDFCGNIYYRLIN